MNILYINHYAGSIYHGMEYRPYYLAREWVKLGHQVTIVASGFSHLRQKNIIIPVGESYARENIDGITYIWCKTPQYPVNGFRRVINILFFLTRLRKLMPRLIQESKPDIVIASSTYPFDTKIAAKIAEKSQAKLVYEVHDLWPLTPMELGGMSKYHPFIWLMQRAENFGYKHANKVVSLLPKAAEYMQEHGMAASKFTYIPNGVCVAEWQTKQEELPEEHKLQVVKLKASGVFLIGYAGGMGESNALGYLLEAAAKLQDTKIALVLIGDGVTKTQLLIKVKVEKLNNVFFLPAIRKTQIPAFLAQMDALYIGWNKLPIYRFGICPNKLFDYMLAAKPIIHSVSAGNDLVAEANCGISVPAQDVDGIVTAMRNLTEMDQTQLTKWGTNGYDYVVKKHDYAVLAAKFLDECSA
jgi:glycosyltransferase involved in cell wall biosynthesis